MLSDFLAKTASNLFMLFEIIVLCIFAVGLIYITFRFGVGAIQSVRRRWYLYRLPDLISDLKVKICSDLRTLNNSLSDDQKISPEIWRTVNSEIVRAERNWFALDETTLVDGLRVPGVLYRIYFEWESATAAPDIPRETFGREVADRALRRIRENHFAALTELRRLKNDQTQSSLKKISISDH